MPEGNCPRETGCPREAGYVTLTLEELEAVRLVDLLELEQEEAAFYMGISRKAFWNDLVSARKKITSALVYGSGIRIEGGTYIVRDLDNNSAFQDEARVQSAMKEDEVSLLEREILVVMDRLNHLTTRLASLKKGSDSPAGNEV